MLVKALDCSLNPGLSSREFSPHHSSKHRRAAMPSNRFSTTRFRTRREAERALAEIVEDGGQLTEFRIDEGADGTCVITVLERDGGPIAGTIGA
jgi:hypothetical protein